MNEHETGFVSAFIIPERRERYLSLLGNPKRRGKVLNRLNHSQDIDFSVARPVPPGCDRESLAALLEKMGAGPICYVIADASDMDGQTMPSGRLYGGLAFTVSGLFELSGGTPVLLQAGISDSRIHTGTTTA